MWRHNHSEDYEEDANDCISKSNYESNQNEQTPKRPARLTLFCFLTGTRAMLHVRQEATLT
jgi:hypothetical protein